MSSDRKLDDMIVWLSVSSIYDRKDISSDDMLALHKWLTELRDLRRNQANIGRVELSIKDTNEYAKAIKALYMACDELGNYTCCDVESNECIHDCGAHMMEYFLKKAGEEND